MKRISEVQLNEAIRRFAAASSRLADTYDDLKAEWVPDAPPISIVFSAFGRAICGATAHSTNEELYGIWQTVEDLILRGDDVVKNAVTTGLLEAILSESSAGRFCMSSVSEHFGPATLSYCRAWDEFTGCKTKGIA